MLRIHREGKATLLLSAGILLVLHLGIAYFWPSAQPFFLLASLSLYAIIVHFFRNPLRAVPLKGEGLVYAPADGKVVVIEKVFENEYFKDERIQLSIFMSPLNVHVNRAPISGEVRFFRYHAGKYLVAWHPKSSSENERTSLVIADGKRELLLRQIAGAMARRIVCYPKEGEHLLQGEDFGFIKFGSRVDVFLPLSAQIQVSVGQQVKGNLSLLAKFP
jgi:phosphatidylserine decarboxylase